MGVPSFILGKVIKTKFKYWSQGFFMNATEVKSFLLE
jgi:hypothetical protein